MVDERTTPRLWRGLSPPSFSPLSSVLVRLTRRRGAGGDALCAAPAPPPAGSGAWDRAAAPAPAKPPPPPEAPWAGRVRLGALRDSGRPGTSSEASSSSSQSSHMREGRLNRLLPPSSAPGSWLRAALPGPRLSFRPRPDEELSELGEPRPSPRELQLLIRPSSMRAGELALLVAELVRRKRRGRTPGAATPASGPPRSAPEARGTPPPVAVVLVARDSGGAGESCCHSQGAEEGADTKRSCARRPTPSARRPMMLCTLRMASRNSARPIFWSGCESSGTAPQGARGTPRSSTAMHTPVSPSMVSAHARMTRARSEVEIRAPRSPPSAGAPGRAPSTSLGWRIESKSCSARAR
mmetsp:Transcript_83389/g.236131  ORF Transcript_83389/g.236131 Transcript_83389/m.236131 type:complete len:353 (-) Transcript_83389:118-1176(-)